MWLGRRPPWRSALPGPGRPQQGPGGLHHNVEGEGEESEADEAADLLLRGGNGLWSGAAGLDGQPPEEHAGGGQFDHAVEPEADQRDAAGAVSRPEGDEGLHRVVGHGGADEPEADALPAPGVGLRTVAHR